MKQSPIAILGLPQILIASPITQISWRRVKVESIEKLSTHQQTGIIKLQEEDSSQKLNAFCLNHKGQIIAVCGMGPGEIRVVDDEGNMLGEMDTDKARELAREAGLDLGQDVEHQRAGDPRPPDDGDEAHQVPGQPRECGGRARHQDAVAAEDAILAINMNDPRSELVNLDKVSGMVKKLRKTWLF